LDISLANTPNIEINGIQTCIAGDDYTYATFPIDMARKYNKPINLTDMVDFPYGLYSGFDAIYKGCMASVQHGMDGLFAYCWYAKWPPAYNYYTHLTARENEILLTDTQNAIESLKNYQLNTKVAFLMPLMTFSLADENGRKGDNLDNFGLYHLVLDTGYMPDVITTYELEKGIIDSLSKYRVIFLPDCPVISPENNKTLIEYVQNGGTIISSGQLPEYDLAYKKLENGFSSKFKISKNGIELVGKGKVVNINDKIGRSYMGKVRRWREAGNTPQVYMRLDRSRKEKIRRDFVRNKFYERVKSTGFTPDVIIPSQKHSVHIATYKNEKTESDKVMFVNKGKRVKSLEVILSNRFSSRNKANAFVDFDKSYPVEINEGVLRLPPFTTSIILTFEK
jgi:hypothetical protein